MRISPRSFIKITLAIVGLLLLSLPFLHIGLGAALVSETGKPQETLSGFSIPCASRSLWLTQTDRQAHGAFPAGVLANLISGSISLRSVIVLT